MPGSTRILATAPIPPIGREMLGAVGEVIVAEAGDEAELACAEVLIVRSQSVDSSLLERAPRLRALARTGTGLDKIDLVAATRRSVPVLYAPDAGTRPVAEGTLALIFATMKRLYELRLLVSENRWAERYDYEVRDLDGATLGIVGLGRIGSEVARLAAGIGMKVIYHDARNHIEDPAFGAGRAAGLAPLFRESDVISLHCNLSETTRGMIDRELLSQAKPGAILINASRGELIDGTALLAEALDRGWLAGVGLDVFPTEPPRGCQPLVDDPRVVCTPHSIGLTRAWNRRVFGSLASDIGLLLAGGAPVNIANPEVLNADATGRS
ncbi:MAG TPA: NAD(P)-dependent oxidoreductase [Solirubrobacterales bacterium]|nr:NAD(P)-dependent oxidoreductase [Solirubrobacterales bacterium]